MCAYRGRGGRSGEVDSWHNVPEIGSSEYTNTITSVAKDNYLIEMYETEDIPNRTSLEKQG